MRIRRIGGVEGLAATLHLMVGLPGSGKTTEARRIEAETGAVRFTPDEWHLALFGDDLADPLHDLRHDRIERLMWRLADDLLRKGVSVILDFGFWSRAERDDFRERGRQAGAEVVMHALVLPFDVLLARITARTEGDPQGNYRIGREHLVRWFEMFEVPGVDEV